jgi:hypothetical protein
MIPSSLNVLARDDYPGYESIYLVHTGHWFNTFYRIYPGELIQTDREKAIINTIGAVESCHHWNPQEVLLSVFTLLLIGILSD